MILTTLRTRFSLQDFSSRPLPGQTNALRILISRLVRYDSKLLDDLGNSPAAKVLAFQDPVILFRTESLIEVSIPCAPDIRISAQADDDHIQDGGRELTHIALNRRTCFD